MDKISRKALIVMVLISLSLSAASSFATYHFLKKDFPRFAVINLHYLQTEFIQNLSRYLADNHVDIGNDKLESIISSEQRVLEELLAEVSTKENLILLQKQTIAAGDVKDVTDVVERRLFQIISKQIKSEVTNEEKNQ